MEKKIFESNDRKTACTFHKRREADDKKQAIGSKQTQISEKTPENVAIPPENTASVKANGRCIKGSEEFVEKRSSFEPLTFEFLESHATRMTLSPCQQKKKTLLLVFNLI